MAKINDYFESMKNSSLAFCDLKSLVDITEIEIDGNGEKTNRLCEFIKKIGNPYLFRIGNVAVKVTYGNGESTFQEKFEKLITDNIRK